MYFNGVRHFLGLWAVGSLIGTTLDVDFFTLWRRGIVRILVGMLNSMGDDVDDEGTGKDQGVEGSLGSAGLPGSQVTNMEVDANQSSGTPNHGKLVASFVQTPLQSGVAITPYNPNL